VSIVSHGQPGYDPQPGDHAGDQFEIDWRLLDSLAAMSSRGSATVTQAITIFHEEISAILVRIAQAMHANDRQLIRDLAHRSRGGSYQLGARTLAAYCATLEYEAETASVERMQQILQFMQQAFEQSVALLMERYPPLD
jgi:HPt (histidine-containing phosphotransfer) domain-containing protein